MGIEEPRDIELAPDFKAVPSGEHDRLWYDNQFDLAIDIVKLAGGIRSRQIRLGEKLRQANKSLAPEEGHLFSISFDRPLTRIEIVRVNIESQSVTHLKVGQFGALHGLPKFTSDLIEIGLPGPNLGNECARVYAFSPDRRFCLIVNDECHIENILAENGHIDAINGSLEGKIAEAHQKDEDDIPF